MPDERLSEAETLVALQALIGKPCSAGVFVCDTDPFDISAAYPVVLLRGELDVRGNPDGTGLILGIGPSGSVSIPGNSLSVGALHPGDRLDVSLGTYHDRRALWLSIALQEAGNEAG